MASKRQDGYVIVHVGKHHHLANSQGWAREHRLVAEAMLGRRLKRGEEVHHINGDRADNRPENLQVVTRHQHKQLHAADPSKWMGPGESNRIIKCACGCYGNLYEFGKDGRRRKYIHGHHMRGQKRQGLRGKILAT